MFSGSGNTEEQVEILSDVWVYRKHGSHINGSRNEITFILACINDSNEIPTAKSVFGVQLRNGNSDIIVRTARKWKIENGGPYTGNTNTSACRTDKNKILKIALMFLGSAVD